MFHTRSWSEYTTLIRMEENVPLSVKLGSDPSALLLLTQSSPPTAPISVETSQSTAPGYCQMKLSSRCLKNFCFWNIFICTLWILYYCYDAQEDWGEKHFSQINNKTLVSHLFQIYPGGGEPKLMGSGLNALCEPHHKVEQHLSLRPKQAAAQRETSSLPLALGHWA